MKRTIQKELTRLIEYTALTIYGDDNLSSELEEYVKQEQTRIFKKWRDSDKDERIKLAVQVLLSTIEVQGGEYS